MTENFNKATQEIKEIIKKYNLSDTEVEILFIEIIKENAFNDFAQKMGNAFEKAICHKSLDLLH